jgi:hypothetical protein
VLVIDRYGDASIPSAIRTISVVSPLAIVSIAAVSPSPRNSPVATIDVTFTDPINLATFTTAALTLTDNGKARPLTGAVTIGLVSGSTYQIGGLTGLTGTDGQYTLTVNTAGIQDQYGNHGSSSLSTSWLMDTTPPTSTVDPLPQRGTTLSFPVSVSGSDPGGPGSAPPSGAASYDIEVSTNGGPWMAWTTVAATNSTALFTGQSNTTYAFCSFARDQAGNTEAKAPAIEASIYLPDLTPPFTAIAGTAGDYPSTVDTTSGLFTLSVTGRDAGGSGLAYVEVFAAVDAGSFAQVSPAVPACTSDAQGIYHATLAYQGLTDGVTHTYRFFSLGSDGAGNVQAAPTLPDLTLAETFAPPVALQVTGLTVERGAAERSYIRYLDILLNETDSQSGGQLSQLAGSVGTASPAIQLYRYDLNGTAASKTAVALGAPVNVAVLDHAIELDFGASGIGELAGSNNTIAVDGYYELDVLLPNGQTAVHHFYRLLGDVTGDRVVDSNDVNTIATAVSQTAPSGMTPLSADVNGDGTVSAFDMTLATRSKGRKLGSGLPLG